MKYLKLCSAALLLAAVAITWSFTQTAGKATSTEELEQEQIWQHVVDYAKENLPLEGSLRMKSDGFVYVKVDDNYIHTLFPMLNLAEEGYREPPYFRSAQAPGAHISVFYEDENVFPEKELGKTYHFTLQKIIIVTPSKSTTYAVLQVDAPELEALREHYGLKPKLHGHEFHISLAKRVTKHSSRYPKTVAGNTP
jgi:hypothetical protein